MNDSKLRKWLYNIQKNKKQKTTPILSAINYMEWNKYRKTIVLDIASSYTIRKMAL